MARRPKRKRAIERGIDKLERTVATTEAERRPAVPDRLVTQAMIREGLWARLLAPIEVRDEEVVLTGLAAELYWYSARASADRKRREEAEERQRQHAHEQAWLDFWRRSAGAWTQALRGVKQVDNADIIPISRGAESSGLGGFAAANDFGAYDDSPPLRGPSEYELMQWWKQNGSG